MCGLEYKEGALYRNGKRAGWLQKNGYRMLSYEGRKVLEHRLIWFLHHGTWPSGLDHINQDKTDNRLENLRDVSAVVNSHNVAQPNRDNETTRVRGVHLHKGTGKYRSQITINRKKVELGLFDSIEEARSAYLSMKPLE